MYIFLYFMLYNTVFITTSPEFLQKKIRTSLRNPDLFGNFFNISLNFHMTNIVRIENK